MSKASREYLPILPAVIGFSLIAFWLNFTQDDAYISYRYVANFLNGDGLVFNIGERVEGFTNFGWVVYMILWGGLGMSYIVISKLTGFLLGAATIIVTHNIARVLFSDDKNWFRYLPAYLVGGNLSLAYWSPAGLETAAFVFFASLAILWYLQRNRLLIFALLLAVWIRPDGAVVAALLILVEAITERKFPSFSFTCAGIALVLSLPFVIFKLMYYGSILPNPFYAKTGLSWGYLVAGAEYAGEFFTHYGFLGIGLIVLMIMFKRISTGSRALLLYVLGYSAYIIVIGGDVLKVHRFFLPIAGLFAVIAATALSVVCAQLSIKTRQLVFVLSGLLLVGLTVYLPYKTVTTFNFNERAFTTRLRFLALEMKRADSTNFTAAIPTIGIFGYELIGHDIIDMLGLTDSTIAQYSDPPIPEMETTWKERRHNSVYLLTRAPDYILFSTGAKPSAPAEKALMLYPHFLESYRMTAWFYQNSTFNARGSLAAAFRKMHPVAGEITPSYPLEFVENYKKGQDALVAGDNPAATEALTKSLAALGNRPPWPELLWAIGTSLMNQKNPRGIEYWDQALALDSLTFGAHKDLYPFELVAGNDAKAAIHRAFVQRLAPWYLGRLDSLAMQMVERKRQAAGQ